jgi:tRNA pseudouridine38-40 synthase
MARVPRRIALLIEYDGGDFVGWQVQGNGRSVQGVLESTIREVFDEKVRVIGAGRTDSGVHATGQVAHLELAHPIPIEKVAAAINSRLSEDVRILAAAEPGPDFHARRDGIMRRYTYDLADGGPRPAIDRRRIVHTPVRLDDALMARAAAGWLGKHDCSSFRDARCQAESPIRTLSRFDVTRLEAGVTVRGEDGNSGTSIIRFTIEARSFLHHQVRIMIGTLVEIGRGERPMEWAAEVLAARARPMAGPTMPAHGLILRTVRYRVEPFQDGCIAKY